MRFHGVVNNVSDLDRSIAFYTQVLGFTTLAQEEQLAVVGVSGDDRSQAIVLRALGTSPLAGAGHIGLRSFILEADSADQLEGITRELESRNLLVGRREHSEWTAVVGRDPEGVTVVVTWHPGGTTEDGWKVLDDFLYGVGE
jgi:catechol 2,3-dioxygenase-like lactoylglutathione lyase family enzyme